MLSSQGRPPTQTAGFLIYPSGRFVTDPSVHAAATIWTYDLPLHRWVPALRRYLSPDGLHYIDNSTTDFSLVIVDAVTGLKTSLVTSGVVDIFGWSTQGIVYRGQSGTRASIQLLDPQTALSRQLSIPILLPHGLVDGRILWVVGVDANNAPTLLRFDLATARATVMYTFSEPSGSHGSLPYFLGFDHLGDPIIVDAPSSFSSPYKVLLVTGVQQATSLYAGQSGSQFRPAQQAVGDARGIWMVGTDGSLWLYDPAHGVRPISLPPGTQPVAALAGACS